MVLTADNKKMGEDTGIASTTHLVESGMEGVVSISQVLDEEALSFTISTTDYALMLHGLTHSDALQDYVFY
jgi:hypothetical protein